MNHASFFISLLLLWALWNDWLRLLGSHIALKRTRQITAVQIGRDEPLTIDDFLGNGRVLLSKFGSVKSAPPESVLAAAVAR